MTKKDKDENQKKVKEKALGQLVVVQEGKKARWWWVGRDK
jgi:hypothetical protein